MDPLLACPHPFLGQPFLPEQCHHHLEGSKWPPRIRKDPPLENAIIIIMIHVCIWILGWIMLYFSTFPRHL